MVDMSSGDAPGDEAGGVGDDGSAGGEASSAGREAGGAGGEASSAGGEAGDGWQGQLNALGGFIRVQRRLADLSLREMATLTSVSNAYLSQIERGLHQPSLRVLRSIAEALGIAPEDLLRRANILSGEDRVSDGSNPGEGGSGAGRDAAPLGTEAAIATDPRLSPSQREALLNVYRSFRDPG
jgi:transcriptional regulator with XRE-family HTH domain